MAKRYIRLPALREKLGGVSPRTVYRRVEDGTLPAPVKFGALSLWDEAEVDRRLGLAEPEDMEAA